MLYRVDETGDLKFYDMESPLTPEIKNAAETIFYDIDTTTNYENEIQ